MYLHHVLCYLEWIVCRSWDMNNCQDVIYLLSSRIHCPNGVSRFSLFLSQKVLISFLRVFHSTVVVFFRPDEIMYQIEVCNMICCL